MVKTKNIYHLIMGIGLVGVGSCILYWQTSFLRLIFFVLALYLFVAGASRIIHLILNQPRRLSTALNGAADLGIGLFLMFFPRLPYYLVPIFLATNLLLHALIKLVDGILAIRNHNTGVVFAFGSFVFYLTFSVVLYCSPAMHIQTVLVSLGVYCVILGVTYVLDFIHSVIPVRVRKNLKRRVRITLPVWLGALIPHSVLTRLNEFLADSKHRVQDFEDLDLKKTDEKPDLEIFIHVSKSGFCAIGHCDVCFEGELIAYGNYDEASSRPWGIGDGVLLLTNKKQYIPFCLAFNKTTIFSFGLKLNEEQKEAVRQRIGEIKAELIPWSPFENPKNEEIFLAQYKRRAQVECFKFTKGKFKTYFVMSTNCVLLAERIVCSAGTDILNLTGVISPGTFYDYLETEFLKKDSMVISRHVYQLPLTEQDLD